MTNKDLIQQYVDTGVGIPRYQFDKLSNQDKKTYLRKIYISLDYEPNNIKFYYAELPEEKQLEIVKDKNSDIVSQSYYRKRNGELQKEFELIISSDNFGVVYIKNPSEAVQLAAVQKNGKIIEHIQNPSEAVQLAAVQEDGFAISYIQNPSEEVQLAAVQHYSLAIQYIKDPSEAVQLAAAKNNGWWALDIIENPSEAVQMAAVQQNGTAIEHVENPSEAVQLEAVKNNVNALQYIKNPTPRVLALHKQLWER
jgi:hypothetical protein